MHRSVIVPALVAGLLVASCSSAAAPTPQIVYVTPEPTAAFPTASPTLGPTPTRWTPPPALRPTSTPEPIASGGILGERVQALVATVEPLGYSFEDDTGPNGEPALTGTNLDAMAAFFFVNDPVTAVLFRQAGAGDGMKHFVDLFVLHGRVDVVTWVLDKMGTMADTGRVVNDSTVLEDGSVATIATEMSGSDMIVTVTLQSE